MSNGESYVHLPPETAKRLCEVIGKELWAKIESEMIGTWGWVYRMSDIPVRTFITVCVCVAAAR